jgi:hypothetical protein
MMSQQPTITVQESLRGMWVDGYVVYLIVDDMPIIYGKFDSVDSASDYAKNLIGDKLIMPVYVPAFNRG